MHEINIGYDINWPDGFWSNTFELGRQRFIEESEITKMEDSQNKFICIWLKHFLFKSAIIPTALNPRLLTATMVAHHVMTNLRFIIEPSEFLSRIKLKSGMVASSVFEWSPRQFKTNTAAPRSWFDIKGWDPYDLSTHKLKSEVRALACAEICILLQTKELIIK